MSQRFFAVAVLALVTLTAPAFAQTQLAANLDSTQVVGGTSSPASGTGAMTLNVAEDALTYSITLVGLDLDGLQTPADSTDDVTAMHFHIGDRGVNGGVVFGLISPNHDTDDLVIDPVAGTLDGIWENTDTNPLSGQLATLKAGGLYLNVHTTGFPGGAIRGQVEVLVFKDGFESGDSGGWDSSVPLTEDPTL
jgi:CHRD domain